MAKAEMEMEIKITIVKDNWKLRIKAWLIKMYRYFFIPIINAYPVPKGERLYEMSFVKKDDNGYMVDIHKAEYHIVNRHRMLIKKPNCIYQSAKDLHEAKQKFNDLINISVKQN